ncbi:MAG: cytidylate kinase-like family protein [Gemmataceae bacterium]
MPDLLLNDEDRREREGPRHGYRGRGERPGAGRYPAGLTIAISREAGARGGTIAKRAGTKLGWQVYSQELLEYMAQEATLRQQALDQLPAGAAEWVEARLQARIKEQAISANPSIVDLARMILSLGVQGEAVLLGRGAGNILSPRSTLHVRLVAPLEDRVAYMAQWLRLTPEEAAEQVRKRDGRRAEFLTTHFHHQPGDLYQYDMVLNTSLLGEDACADIIVQAAKVKAAALHSPPLEG